MASRNTDSAGSSEQTIYDQVTGDKVAVVKNAVVEGVAQLVTEYFVYDEKRHLRYHVSASGCVTQYIWDTNYSVITKERTQRISRFDVAGYSVHALPTLDHLDQWWSDPEQKITNATLKETAYNEFIQPASESRYAEVAEDGSGIATDASKKTAWPVRTPAGEWLHKTESVSLNQDRCVSRQLDGLQRQVQFYNSRNEVVESMYNDAKQQLQIAHRDAQSKTYRLEHKTWDKSGLLLSKSDQDLLSRNQPEFMTSYQRSPATGVILSSKTPAATFSHVYGPSLQLRASVEETSKRMGEFEYDIHRKVKSESKSSVGSVKKHGETVLRDVSKRIRYEIDGDRFVKENKYDAAGRKIGEIRYATALDIAVPLKLTAKGVLEGIAISVDDRFDVIFRNTDGHELGTQNNWGFVCRYKRDALGWTLQKMQYTKAQPTATTWDEIVQQLPAGQCEQTDYEKDLLANNEIITDPEKFIIQQSWFGNGKWAVRCRKNKDSKKPDHVEKRLFDGERFLTDHEVQPKGVRHHFTPDVHNLVASSTTTDLKTNKVVRETSISRNGLAKIVMKTGPRPGQKQVNVYDLKTSWLMRQLDSFNNCSIFYKNALGETVAFINANGFVTRYAYNEFGDKQAKRIITKKILADDLEKLVGGQMTDEIDALFRSYESDNDDIINSFDYNGRGMVFAKTDGDQYQKRYYFNAYQEADRIEEDVEKQDGLVLVRVTTSKKTKLAGGGCQRTTIKDPDDKALETVEQLNHQGKIANQKLPNGAEHDFTYNSKGSPVSHFDHAKSATESWGQDHLNREVSHTNFKNKSSNIDYNDEERSRTYISPLQKKHTVVKDALDQDQIAIDPAKNQHQKLHNAAGDLLSEKDEDGFEASHQPNAEGWEEAVIFPGEKLKHTNQFDAAGGIKVQAQFADNQVYTDVFQNNAEGKPWHHQDAAGGQHTISYDKRRNITIKSTGIQQDTDTVIEQHQFNGLGTDTLSINADRQQVFSSIKEVDALGLPAMVIQDPNGLKLKTKYGRDKQGHATKITDPRGKVHWAIYDLSDNLCFTISPLGIVHECHYNLLDNKIYECTYDNVIDTSSLIPTSSPQDIQNLLARMLIYRSSQKYYFYNDDEEQIYTVTGSGNVTQTLYNEARVPCGVYRYANQINPNQLNLDDISSVKVIADTDLDRLTKKIFNKANKKVRFEINANGQVTEYVFDNKNNPIKVIRYANSLNFSDMQSATLDNIAGLLTPDPENDLVKYQVFDGFNRLRYVVDENNYVSSFEYDGKHKQIDGYVYPQPLMAFPDQITIAFLRERYQPSDPLAYHTHTTYDELERKRSFQVGSIPAESWRYDALKHIRSYIDQAGFEWLTDYDGAARKTADITPETTLYNVDEDIMHPGQIMLTGIERDSLIKQRVLDECGNLLGLQKGALSDVGNRRATHHTLDDDGRCTSITITQAAIDDPDQEVKSPGDSPTTNQDVSRQYVYNAAGKVLVSIDEDNHARFNIYDDEQRLVYEIHPKGNVRHYLRNAFGEVQTMYQYTTKINLDLSQYLKKGLFIADIEVPGVLQKSPSDRAISFKFNRNGKRVETGLPKELLAWVENDQLKWSLDVGRTTQKLYDVFSREIGELRLVHGDPDPDKSNPENYVWQLTQHWLDGHGKPLLTVKSVDGQKFNVVQNTYDHRGLIATEREFDHQFDCDELFVNNNTPLPFAKIAPTLASHIDLDRDHYYVYKRDAEGHELEKRLVNERVQHVVFKQKIQAGGTVSVPYQLVEEAKDLVTKNLAFDPRTGKPIKIQSPGGAITDLNLDELGRDAGKLGPLAANGDPINPGFTREQQIKGYGACGNEPVYDALTFQKFNAKKEQVPSISDPRIALQKHDKRGLVAAKQDRNGHVKRSTYTPGRRLARHYWFRDIYENAPAEEQGLLSAIKKLFSSAPQPDASIFKSTKMPMQHSFKYDANGNKICKLDLNFDGQTTALHVLFNEFDEPVKIGPDGVNWPKTMLPSFSGMPIVEVGQDGVPRVKLYDGLGKQVAQIQKPEGVDIAKQIQSQQDLQALLGQLKDPESYTQYQSTLWLRDRLGHVLKKYHPTYTIKKPQTPEPFYVALEIGADYAQDIGGYSITWPTPADRFLVGTVTLMPHGMTGEQPIVLPITQSKDGLRSGVNITGLPSGYYDYEIDYRYNAVAGGGSDLGDNTPRTYRAVGTALPVITTNQADSREYVARVMNYNQLVIGGQSLLPLSEVDVVFNGVVIKTVTVTKGFDGCFTADLSDLVTGYYSFQIYGQTLATNQLVMTSNMPQAGRLTAFESGLSEIVMPGDCDLQDQFKKHHNKPTELCWMIQDNVEFSGYDSNHPLLSPACNPTVELEWSTKICGLHGTQSLTLEKGKMQGINHIYSSVSDDTKVDDPRLIDGFEYDSLKLTTTLNGEKITLIDSIANLDQTMTPAQSISPESGYARAFKWQRNAIASAKRLIFAGLPAGVAKFTLSYKDFSLYAGPHVIHSHDRWRDITDMGKLSENGTFLIVDSGDIPPGEVNFILTLFDANGNLISIESDKVSITHGKDAIPVPRQHENFMQVRPVESQTLDPHGQAKSQTDAYGNTTPHDFNKRKKRIATKHPEYKHIQADGSEVTSATQKQRGFNEDNHHIGDSDEQDHVTARPVNEAGDSLGHTDADGVYERKVLDGFRDVIKVFGYDMTNKSDPMHTLISLRTYDNMKRLATDTDRTGKALQFGRDEAGNVNHTTSRAGRESCANHDINQHEVERINAAGQSVKTKVDRHGNPLEVDDGIAQPMRYFRDFFGHYDMTQPFQMQDKSGVTYQVRLDNNKLLVSQQSQMSSAKGSKQPFGSHGTQPDPVTGKPVPTPNQDLVYLRDEAGHVIYILDNAANSRFQKFYDQANTCRGERYTNGDGMVAANTWIKFNPLGWITEFLDDILQGEFKYDAKGNRRRTMVSVKEGGKFLVLNQAESWFTYTDGDRVQYDDCAMINGKIDISYDEATGQPKGRVFLYGLDGRLMQEVHKDKHDASGFPSADTNTLVMDIDYASDLKSYKLSCRQQRADGSLTPKVELATYEVDADQILTNKTKTDHLAGTITTQSITPNPVGFTEQIRSSQT